MLAHGTYCTNCQLTTAYHVPYPNNLTPCLPIYSTEHSSLWLAFRRGIDRHNQEHVCVKPFKPQTIDQMQSTVLQLDKATENGDAQRRWLSI